MSEFRCEDGRAMRHSPEHDDPYFERAAGVCERCNGEGCDAKFRRLAGHAMVALSDAIGKLQAIEPAMYAALEGMPAEVEDYFETSIGGVDLPIRDLRCLNAFMEGRLALLDEGGKARSPYMRPDSSYVPPLDRREHKAWQAGFADDNALPVTTGAAA